jgi:predicted DNA-binding protein (UPF0251 family)
VFKPVGVPLCELETVRMETDELEALRLADAEGMYHDQAALELGVSRQTFGRLIRQARRKLVRALLEGRAVAFNGISGGPSSESGD